MSRTCSTATALRKPDYDYAQFAKEWQHFFEVIRQNGCPTLPSPARTPPSTTSGWCPFAKQFKNEAAFLSQHYYAEGPPTDPSMTIERLLQPESSTGA